MFRRVTLTVSDLGASRAFFETVLAPLRLALRATGQDAVACGELELAQGDADAATRGLHLAFVAASQEEVDAFWRAGLAAGYESDGEPGPRPQYTPDYYGAFLLDPEGNSVEAVTFAEPRGGAEVIDHLWIRVGDLATTRRFYDAVAPVLGLELSGERPERFHLAARGRSFALVQGGRVTENLRLAFPVADEAAAAELRRVAAAAGFRTEGRGVLDPDGTLVEALADAVPSGAPDAWP